jgi:hypothetical protein
VALDDLAKLHPALNIERSCGVQRSWHVAPQHRQSAKCVLLPNPQHVRHCGTPP